MTQIPTPPIVENADGSLTFHSENPLPLKSGQLLSGWQLQFETWGQMNAAKSNVVLIHHALSVGSHVTSSEMNPTPGWWQEMVGPGKAVDTDKYYVICINNLGSCFGSSGPMSKAGEACQPWAAKFPKITIDDMVSSQKVLIDYLAIKQLYAIIGNSMGAMLSLNWAIDHPESVARLMSTCSSYKAYPANIANRHIQQEAIRIDPAFKGGCYQPGDHLTGFRLARKLGLYTYRNATEWNRRFNSHGNDDMTDSEINRYMDYNAEQFCQAFDANTYLTLTTAMDLYDVSLKYGSTQQAFARIKAKCTVLSVSSDILFTPQQQQEMYACMTQAELDCIYIDHDSQYGHDAFLVETSLFSEYVMAFLQR